MDKTLQEAKERGGLVLTPQMGAWVPQAGMRGYDFNARQNCVLVAWSWYRGLQAMGLN